MAKDLTGDALNDTYFTNLIYLELLWHWPSLLRAWIEEYKAFYYFKLFRSDDIASASQLSVLHLAGQWRPLTIMFGLFQMPTLSQKGLIQSSTSTWNRDSSNTLYFPCLMFGEAWSPMSVPDLAPDDDESLFISFKNVFDCSWGLGKDSETSSCI